VSVLVEVKKLTTIASWTWAPGCATVIKSVVTKLEAAKIKLAKKGEKPLIQINRASVHLNLICFKLIFNKVFFEKAITIKIATILNPQAKNDP